MDQELRTLEIGKAELLKDGSDVAIIAIGNMVYPVDGGGQAARSRRHLGGGRERPVRKAPR